MKIKEWMIGGTVVIIVALGSVYLTHLVLPVIDQIPLDTSRVAVSEKGRATVKDCIKGVIETVKKWDMPQELREISGIAWIDSTRVATIEDTHAIIFIYNLRDEKVEKQIRFGKTGDFEGIAYAHGSYFILRADGYLIEVSDQGKVIHEYDFPLTAKDDTESLFYDEPNNRLLIGQKEGGKLEKKEIFAFDLKTRQFNPVAVYSFDPNVSFCAPVTASSAAGDSSVTNKGGNKESGSTKSQRGPEVKPSDLAIHPITHEIFIVDGPNDKILVLSPEGVPIYFLKLAKLFEQAEGIMFSPSGDLYISSEGIRYPGNISKVSVNTSIQ